MTLRENEINKRRRHQDERDQSHHYDNHVLSFRQWCELNGFSAATGRRILNSGHGPRVLQLSVRRIGIRESDNAAWQNARAR
jgi:predicted DNA-binding transcriptional regulator AlpA